MAAVSSRSEDDRDDRSPWIKAMEWTTRLTTIALEMALPGVGGFFLDQWLGTRVVFLILGVLIGFLGPGLLFRHRRAAMFPPVWIMAILLVFTAVWGFDGLNSYTFLLGPKVPHLYLPSNPLRLITGMGQGITMDRYPPTDVVFDAAYCNSKKVAMTSALPLRSLPWRTTTPPA